jgi:hypothetical protein
LPISESIISSEEFVSETKIIPKGNRGTLTMSFPNSHRSTLAQKYWSNQCQLRRKYLQNDLGFA